MTYLPVRRSRGVGMPTPAASGAVPRHVGNGRCARVIELICTFVTATKTGSPLRRTKPTAPAAPLARTAPRTTAALAQFSMATGTPTGMATPTEMASAARPAAVADGGVFLRGGARGPAEGAAGALAGKFPALRIAGTLCPPVGFENDAAKMAEIIQVLSAVRPDVVFVALGSPKQER